MSRRTTTSAIRTASRASSTGTTRRCSTSSAPGRSSTCAAGMGAIRTEHLAAAPEIASLPDRLLALLPVLGGGGFRLCLGFCLELRRIGLAGDSHLRGGGRDAAGLVDGERERLGV